jgi:hypothetical protein
MREPGGQFDQRGLEGEERCLESCQVEELGEFDGFAAYPWP